MGLKKMFKKKEPTEKEIIDGLNSANITTKSASGRQEKFGAFRSYAQERLAQRPGMAPVNPYANVQNTGLNPYLNNGSGDTPASGPADGPARSSPYQRESTRAQNPYGGAPLQPPPRSNPYGRDTGRTRPGGLARDDELTLDLNDIPSARPPAQIKQARRAQPTDPLALDLNELPDEDLNVEVDDFLPQEQVNSEDEEVEAIKQDIRFTKQESLALTRNTLRMAQEADASGTNTLGVLGLQSERLYNAEQNLLLADTQTRIAEDKVKELNRLNRSIFIPATGNPFNKKLRLRQQEQKLKAEKETEKYLRDSNRQGMYASEQRLKQGLTNTLSSSETYQKYQGERNLQQAQRYQFENDSEDDEMEKELAANLDQIASYSKKLRSTAATMGQEVDAQNERLRKIEEDADRLDINVHLNSLRLSNIR